MELRRSVGIPRFRVPNQVEPDNIAIPLLQHGERFKKECDRRIVRGRKNSNGYLVLRLHNMEIFQFGDEDALN